MILIKNYIRKYEVHDIDQNAQIKQQIKGGQPPLKKRIVKVKDPKSVRISEITDV